MTSACAKKNAKKHAAKRAKALTAAKKAADPETPDERKVWAEQVIVKNIVWFRSTMTCPFRSLYKAKLLKQHLQNGSLKGTLTDWLKMSSIFTGVFYVDEFHVDEGVFYVDGELNGKYKTTTYVTAEFFDGVDRYVLTQSGSLYQLGQSSEDGNKGCLSVDEERKNARLTFPRQLRLSVEHEKRLSAKDT